MRVDLPAFGKPTRATSARSFSSRARLAALALRAGLGAPGRAVRGGGEVLVAAPALAPLRDEEDLAVLGEVAEDLARVGVLDEGADGDGDLDVARPSSPCSSSPCRAGRGRPRTAS